VKAPASPAGHGEFAPDPAFGGKMSPDAIRSQIQDQKSGISALQTQITELNDSIHFAGANCVANCAVWNDSQLQKQRQVEDMRSELENAKQALEQMQDYARKMGFGGSVYDPEQ
jgi:multidrug resistance efflux pump